MNAVNYDTLMQQEMERAADGSKLLLHCCCAPCSTYCLQTLHEKFRISVYFYNPNLDTEEEFRRRRQEEVRLLHETGWGEMLEWTYSSADYKEIAKGREKEKEGGERCRRCYYLRLEKTAKTAKELGYDYFATTLTISPLKNSEVINQIGFELAKKYGVKYLPSDFKKRNGYLQSVSLSKEFSLYRQNYCGCRYSKESGVRNPIPEEE